MEAKIKAGNLHKDLEPFGWAPAPFPAISLLGTDGFERLVVNGVKHYNNVPVDWFIRIQQKSDPSVELYNWKVNSNRSRLKRNRRKRDNFSAHNVTKSSNSDDQPRMSVRL